MAERSYRPSKYYLTAKVIIFCFLSTFKTKTLKHHMKKPRVSNGQFISICKLEVAFSFRASGATHRGTEVKRVSSIKIRNQHYQQIM